MPDTANDNRQGRPLTGRAVLLYLIGFFAVVGAANAIMARAAISTFSGAETLSSYQAGLSFTRNAEAAQAQDALHWQVTAKVRPSADKALLDVDARDAAHRPLTGLQATAHLARPTDAREDQDITLREISPGRFDGSAVATSGQWDLIIELSRDGRRMFRSRNRIVLN